MQISEENGRAMAFLVEYVPDVLNVYQSLSGKLFPCGFEDRPQIFSGSSVHSIDSTISILNFSDSFAKIFTFSARCSSGHPLFGADAVLRVVRICQ